MKHTIILLLCTVVTIYGQIPIPSRPLGYTYGLGSTFAPIQFTVYLGPVCPDCKNAFPTILKVADHYGSQTLRLVSHHFPLPYHRNSFLAAKGAQIVRVMNKNMTYNWMANVYANLDRLGNDATHNATEAQVEAIYTSIAASMGLNAATFSSMFKDQTLEDATRLDWKYTATRGVAWTPAFMINDVLVQASPTWTVEDWSKVIDPLLGRPVKQTSTHTECKFGTKKCEYIPGKVECCTKGEACIPNVGCRC